MAQEKGLGVEQGLSDSECAPPQALQPRGCSGDEIPSANHTIFRDTELLKDAQPRSDNVFIEDTNEGNPKQTLTKQLLEAIDCDNVKKLLRLLGAGADPNATYPLSPRQQEYLHQVVWDEDGDDYKRIPTWEGGSPAWSVLHFASAACAARCVRALLSRGARASAAHAQRTPLDVAGAALYGGRSVRPDQFEQVVCALARAGGACGACDGAVHALHTAARLRSPRAARALLAAGARAALDSDGLTPMHIAVGLECEDVLQTLLEAEPGCAAARARGGASLLFAAVRARWAAGAGAALRAGAPGAALCPHPRRTRGNGHPIKVTPLHVAVEINHVDIVDKILTLSKDKNLNCLNSENETPLCTAIERGHLACAKLLVRHGASLCDIHGKSNALHVAAFYSYPNGVSILKYLLEETDVSDIINSPNDWHQGPIHRAVISGPEPVKMLLDKGADIRLKIGGESNDHDRWFTPLHLAAMMQDRATAQMILSYDRTTIDEVDALGRTPLLVAILNHAEEVVTTILHAGGLLSSSSKGVEQQSAIEMITDKLPNPTEFFERCFDSSLYRVGSVGSADVVVDFSIFTNNHERNQLKAIEELSRCGQHEVLLHPLVKALLYLKWKNLVPLFYVLLGTYASFVFTLNLFVGLFYYDIDLEELPPFVFAIVFVDFILLYISLLCILITELPCMHARGRRYWCSLETWVKLGSCALGAALPPALWMAGAGAGPRHTASAGLLLAWLQLMMLLARLPEGHYVLIIGKVATTIAKIFATFIFVVSAFALSFMVQFQSTRPFDGPLAALTKTFVMMTSEFAYESLFGDKHASALMNTRPVVTILFLLFVVFVSIVMMNFIVGMAVSDINSLIITGNARKLEKQLEILVTLETLVCDGIIDDILPSKVVSTINKRRFLTKMVLNLGTSKTWTVHCEDAENNYEMEMPSSFHQTAISKSRMLTETEFEDRKLKNMATMLYHAAIEKDGIDPLNFREHRGGRVRTKFDDILARMETLTEAREDLCKLKKFYEYKERELTRERPKYLENLSFRQSQMETEKV